MAGMERGLPTAFINKAWTHLLAAVGFVWAIYGFILFAREYSTAPANPGTNIATASRPKSGRTSCSLRRYIWCWGSWWRD